MGKGKRLGPLTCKGVVQFWCRFGWATGLLKGVNPVAILIRDLPPSFDSGAALKHVWEGG